MKLRILTALVLIPPVVFLIGWSPRWLFLLALLVTVELGLYEYFSISRQSGLMSIPAVGYVAGAIVCIAQAAEPRKPGFWPFSVLAFVVLVTLALGLLRTSDLKNYLGVTSSTFFGILYVGFTLSCLVPLRFSDPSTGRNRMLLLFVVLWSGDICAFLVGRSIGRRLLFPRVSPKKTVEGAIGGFFGSLVVAWAYARWFWQTADLKTVMLWAGWIAVAGQVGDLVESAIKRGADLKDSGAILPGHGGLLDRIDSLLFGAPAFWFALALGDVWRS